jgi:tripartite-type tricarboxylate transporter receptor subunit TctC
MNAHGVHFMLFAPAATPKPVVALLETELKKVISDPALKRRFAEIGFDATPLSAEEVAATMRQTAEKLGPVIKRLNIKLD